MDDLAQIATQTQLAATEIALTSAPQISPKDGMVMVYVPAGEFLMGSTTDDPDAYSDELIKTA
ncbi:MAG: hypothetical protein AB1649_27470 [Chloroflexota bacterium]